jgi:hypothetical protein
MREPSSTMQKHLATSRIMATKPCSEEEGATSTTTSTTTSGSSSSALSVDNNGPYTVVSNQRLECEVSPPGTLSRKKDVGVDFVLLHSDALRALKHTYGFVVHPEFSATVVRDKFGTLLMEVLCVCVFVCVSFFLVLLYTGIFFVELSLPAYISFYLSYRYISFYLSYRSIFVYLSYRYIFFELSYRYVSFYLFFFVSWRFTSVRSGSSPQTQARAVLYANNLL